MSVDSGHQHDDVVVFVLGTRPEIIKLAPLAPHLGHRLRVAYTGQHYDPGMADVFFAACGLRDPDVTLHVGGQSRGAQIGAAVVRLDDIFQAWRPAAVVVQGDTNAGAAGAIAANARQIPLVHIEAGLRSFDRRMPEEHNRVMIDHLSDVLCAATEGNRTNLLREGTDPARVVVTGNTVIEAVARHLPDAENRSKILANHGLSANGFVLATVHRPENTDDPRTLTTILNELSNIARSGWPVVVPMHPRTQAAVQHQGGTSLLRRLQCVEPVNYPEFLSLAAESAAVVSDSGGVQEEVTVLKRPLIVVRRSTERPESLHHFATLVPPGPHIGTELRRLLTDVAAEHQRLARLGSPFGDGSASSQISKIINTLAERG